MGEYFFDDCLVLDSGDYPGGTAADSTPLYIDVEYSLESLGPRHGYMTIGFCILGALLCCGFWTALASLCRGDQGSMFAVGCPLQSDK